MRYFWFGLAFCVPGVLFSQSHSDQLIVENVSAQDTFYVSVEQLPEPIGGIMAIQQNVVYPESARRDSVEGTVYVEAFIDEQGNVVRTSIVKGVREDLDKAASDAVAKVKFSPGKLQGKAVKVKLAIPIRFKLGRGQVAPFTGKVNEPTVIIVQGPQAVAKLIRYPTLAIKAGIEGTVFANVVLDEHRSVKQVTIVRGIGAGCDVAVLRGLASYEFGRDPAYQRTAGTEVVSITVPVIVQFALPKK